MLKISTHHDFALFALGFCLLELATNFAHADGLLLLPSFTSISQKTTDSTVTPTTSTTEIERAKAVDIFYSYNDSSLRVLAEYLYTNSEKDLERFQVGWRYSTNHTVWVGRFHVPNSYWNTQFHHGSFLQPSLSKPSIANYEDDNGLLSVHQTGLLFEGNFSLNNEGRELVYAASLGAGPKFDSALEPVDLLNPHQPSKLMLALRIGYVPDDSSLNQYGITFGSGDIAVTNLAISAHSLMQRQAGFFIDHSWFNFHLISELQWVETEGFTGKTDRFGNHYEQLEWHFFKNLMLYGRYDKTFSQDLNSASYQAVFTHSLAEQQALGVRVDFGSHNSLKFETARGHFLDGNEQTQVSVQWSAIFP